MDLTLSTLTDFYRRLSTTRTLVALVVAGVLLRVLWIMLVDTTPISDPMVYLSRATSIANGDGYIYPDGTPTAYWPVGYPAFLAGVLWLTQGSLLAGKLANIVLFIATAAVFAKVAQAYQKHSIGLVVVAYLALSPNQIAYANLYASEPLALFFVALTVYALIQLVKHQHWKMLALASLSTAIGAYVKPQIVIFPGAILILYSILNRNPMHLLHLGIIALTTILVISPWAYRNYNQFGEIIPVSNNGGINLYIGNNPHANGSYKFNDQVKAPLEGLSETEQDKQAKKLAVQYILNEPISALQLVPRKLLALYKTDAEGIAWNLEGIESPTTNERKALTASKWLAQVLYMALFLVSALCLLPALKVAITRKNLEACIPIVVVAAGTAVYLMFFGTTRFHYVFLPFLFFYTDFLVGQTAKNNYELTKPREL